jgi:hypothetical protein
MPESPKTWYLRQVELFIAFIFFYNTLSINNYKD